MTDTRPIFVFGSNRAGRHGKGAARYATQHYGAEYGVGEGMTGRAYAIPTKGRNLEVLSLTEIEFGVGRFLDHAATSRALFLVTPIGCGLAGHAARDVWNMFTCYGVPDNVMFSRHWATDHRLTESAQ
jgi:hypothetical protein